jgi:hypothetical protein
MALPHATHNIRMAVHTSGRLLQFLAGAMSFFVPLLVGTYLRPPMNVFDRLRGGQRVLVLGPIPATRHTLFHDVFGEE